MIILITGVFGQDGTNLTNYLLKNTDHKIVGTTRNITSTHEYVSNPRFTLKYMDLTDDESIHNVFSEIMPDYFINFAAQTFVGESWKSPKSTFMINTISLITILELIRKLKPTCRFYSAGSSEEFGDVETVPQTLSHPLKPRSPYGASKCAARHIVKVYRESYKLYTIHCVLFNHEGIRRGKQFVTRKITSNLARIKFELENNLVPTPFQLGNINVRRDWSDSEDFVEAIWIMLNQDHPKEYILSSNIDYSIKDFINKTCEILQLIPSWNNDPNPLNTVLKINNHIVMTISKEFYRPADIAIVRGNCKSTLEQLNWKPKSTFHDLVKKMAEYDYQMILNDKSD